MPAVSPGVTHWPVQCQLYSVQLNRVSLNHYNRSQRLKNINNIARLWSGQQYCTRFLCKLVKDVLKTKQQQPHTHTHTRLTASFSKQISKKCACNFKVYLHYTLACTISFSLNMLDIIKSHSKRIFTMICTDYNISFHEEFI